MRSKPPRVKFGRLLRLSAQERGAALVVALLVMVICALLGASAIMTSTTDLQISRQERLYHLVFGSADAGIRWLMTQTEELFDSVNDPCQDPEYWSSPIPEGALPQGFLSFRLAPIPDYSDVEAKYCSFQKVGTKTESTGAIRPVYKVRMEGREGANPSGSGRFLVTAELTLAVNPNADVEKKQKKEY